jgi:hypothetical protein
MMIIRLRFNRLGNEQVSIADRSQTYRIKIQAAD